jgi:Replication-relaxation
MRVAGEAVGSARYVRLPAYADVAWTAQQFRLQAVLVPDLGELPIQVHARSLARLRSLSTSNSECRRFVVVAAPAGRRLHAWRTLIEELWRAHGISPSVTIVIWSDVHAGDRILADAESFAHRHSVTRRPSEGGSFRPEPRPLVRTRVGAPGRGAALVAKLTPSERDLLELIGRHPFLPIRSVTIALGWTAPAARGRCRALVERGLVRALGAEEASTSARLYCLELTAAGLAASARLNGLTPAAAVRELGLAGGGPDHPMGNRSLSLRDLPHTLGADAMFVQLIATARQRLIQQASDDALVDWRGAAGCARYGVQPDGYGLYRTAGHLYGFLLEYDRGTMRARDYRRKFAAYYRYRDTGRFRDYTGFPTILVVTSGPGAENRIGAVLSAAAVGRQPPLPVLITTVGWIEAHPDGLLGPVWRETGAATRRPWRQDALQTSPTLLAGGRAFDQKEGGASSILLSVR